jgi:hypothetical protein
MDETRAGEVRSSVIQGKTTGRPPSRARARHINQDHMSGVDGRTSPATASAKRGRAAGGHPPPKCRHQPARGRVAWIATRGGRGTHHQPQAAAGPLFLFFGPLAVDRQAVQKRAHHGRHRHAPVARGSRDAAPLPPHACRRQRRHCHFPDGPANCWTYDRPVYQAPLPSIYALPWRGEDHGARTVGWHLLADADFRNGATLTSGREYTMLHIYSH